MYKLEIENAVTIFLYVFCFFRYGMSLFRAVGVDHKQVFLPMLRGFPDNLMEKIRRQPSVALLRNLAIK